MTVKLIIGLMTSFLVSLVIAPILIKFLKKLKFGQTILEIGPSWHKSKQGTPTMGGIIFIIGIGVSVIISAVFFSLENVVFLLVCFAISLCYGIIGFIDDYIKVVKKQNLGLTSLQKIVMQTLVAVCIMVYYAYINSGSTSIVLPFGNLELDLGIFYYLFAFIVIVGTVNSVNLTDGIDGLATSVTIAVVMFFAICSIVKGAAPVAIYCVAVIGGLAAFLIFNAHPAKVFMGDTGSLFLGGTVVAVAFALNRPVIILICGIVYFFEAISVILQVGYYKLTKKRLFKMAPYHHHLEKCGFSENKVVLTFVAVTLIGCTIALFGIL